jgi:hypothetical protein
MSTDLISLFGAIQRGDTREIASHLFPPASADTARKSYMTSQGQKDVPNAGLGSVEAGTSAKRDRELYPVTCRAHFYDIATKILEDELRLLTHTNADELGLLIEQWIEKKRENWEPR